MIEELIIDGTETKWKKLPLGSVFKTTSGGTPSRRNPAFYNGTIPWVKSGELESNIILDTEEKITQEAINASSAKIFPKGTLLIALYGATIGKLAKLGIDAATNQAVCGIFENEEHDLDYLYWFLFRKRRDLIKAGIGGAQPNISQAILKSLEILLPPKEVQQQIVSKIEELFSELDKGIEELKTAQQRLKVYRQAVLKWAFEGKLTNEDVKDGELPERWQLKAINEVAKLNPKLPSKENISDDLEVQFLPMKLVEEVVNKVHLDETKKFKDVQKGSYTPFINGDVIFAKVTPCMENGKVAVVENLKNGIGYGSSEFHVIRCSDELLNKFAFYFIVQDNFRNEATNAMTGAVGLRRVPKQFIENYIIPLPTVEEQQQIVQEIESRLSVCDKIEETITNSLKQAEALRQSILKKAFEGKLL